MDFVFKSGDALLCPFPDWGEAKNRHLVHPPPPSSHRLRHVGLCFCRAHGRQDPQKCHSSDMTLTGTKPSFDADSYATPEEGLAMLLESEGGCVDVKAAAKLYRKPTPVKSQAITKQIREGNMIAYKFGDGQYFIPTWQFAATGDILPGLGEVIAALRKSVPAYTQLTPFAFLLQPHSITAPYTPLEQIRRGDVASAVKAALSERE